VHAKVTNTQTFKKGIHMKKTLIVAALAAVMLFAFASSAFANWGGWTGSSLYDTAPGAPRHSTSYLLWDDVVDDGDNNTPHKGYTNSSTLCAVCHSVHYAPVFEGQVPTNTVTGAWAPSGANGGSTYSDAASYIAANPGGYPTQAQMLLRSGAGTACNYCHVDSSIGGKVVYAGQSDIFGYAQNFTSSYAHNWHDAGCNDCHSVHGANTYDGALTSAILNRQPRSRDPQREVIGAITSSNTDVAPLYATLADAYAGTDRDIQTTAFCSSCHYVYNTSSAQAIKERGGTAVFTKHHPMADALTSRSAAAGAAKGANDITDEIQWAWTGSNTCRSCHSAGLDGSDANSGLTGYTDQSFPHYTKGNYRFLSQSSDAAYATDEVCLDCHRNAAGTAGVGVSF
jgi:hypothetical protein